MNKKMQCVKVLPQLTNAYKIAHFIINENEREHRIINHSKIGANPAKDGSP